MFHIFCSFNFYLFTIEFDRRFKGSHRNTHIIILIVPRNIFPMFDQGINFQFTTLESVQEWDLFRASATVGWGTACGWSGIFTCKQQNPIKSKIQSSQSKVTQVICKEDKEQVKILINCFRTTKWIWMYFVVFFVHGFVKYLEFVKEISVTSKLTTVGNLLICLVSSLHVYIMSCIWSPWMRTLW